MEYNPFTLSFVYQFIFPGPGSDHPEAKSKVVEIYLPGRRYTTLLHEKKAVIQISDGTWQYLGKVRLCPAVRDQPDQLTRLTGAIAAMDHYR